ncbi:retrovirus-related Pol polyprotein from transposon TNT 1-94 [Trichonephila clavipes]|nr:retrovirus-related Pol polyprotein from transposon TNT 1-94 [Trichonephila clavipes]
MRQPQGFESLNKINHVCLLKKAIYGLHQSGREWYEFDNALENLDFVKLNWCNCVYIYKENVLLIVYIDDIAMFGKSQDDIDNVVSLLQSKFDLKVLGKIKKLLGIEFSDINGQYFIHQKQYIDKICKVFSKYNFPHASLPIAKGAVLSKLDCPSNAIEVEEMSKFSYRNLLGCLSFFANRTPDLIPVMLLTSFPNFKNLPEKNIGIFY